MKALKNILDVHEVQLHQLTNDYILRLIVSSDADQRPSGTAGVQKQGQDPVQRFLFGRMVQEKGLIIQAFSEIGFIQLSPADPILIRSGTDRSILSIV